MARAAHPQSEHAVPCKYLILNRVFVSILFICGFKV